MYNWFSFQFCETYLLHIKLFVGNKSAIFPFFGEADSPRVHWSLREAWRKGHYAETHRHGWLQRLRIGGREDRCAALLPSARVCPDAHEKCNLQGQTLTMSERWTRWRRRSPRRRAVLVHSLPLANIQLTHWLCRTQRLGRCQSVHAQTMRIRNHQAAPLRRSFSTIPKPQAQVHVLRRHQCLDVHILRASDRMMTPVFSCGQNGASRFGQSPMKMMTVAIRRTIGMRPG